MTSTVEAPNATTALRALGQSTWLDYIRRGMLENGDLARMIRNGWITGMTSNPTIFEKALSGSDDYDQAIFAIAESGRRPSAYDAFIEMAVEDIQLACDEMRQVYDETQGKDGYVSLEVPPGTEHDTDATKAEVGRLFRLVARPNVMIKIPGNPEGIAAVEDMVAEGININITLLFAVSAYEASAEAYIRGLERRLEAGQPIERVASVASFFVSRVDTVVDEELPEGSPLRGKAAIANARRAYRRFQEIFSGPRWERLTAAGAMVQRPLWASTSTKNKAYSDVLYVDELIAPDTVNTMPEATLKAVLDHADVRPTVVPNLEAAEETLAALAKAGIDMDQVTAKLIHDGLESFANDFGKLLTRVASSIAQARVGAPGDVPPALRSAVEGRLKHFGEEKLVERIWSGDHTAWKPDPTEIADRLGWLHSYEAMQRDAGSLREFAAQVAQDGYSDAVLLGMGGSSLAPEVFAATFGAAPGALNVHVLDTTDPVQIADLESRIDLAKTLFIVASKSGTTIETRSHFDYFWSKLADGAHYVVITDAGSPLEALGKERGVRRVFQNQSDIGGRYSVLSHFGMVPAALLGVDLDRLLAEAADMALACRPVMAPAENPGAWLGAVLGEAARAGRDKLTLVLPDQIAAFGSWVEQLIAESTGKEGRGIVPVVGESFDGRTGFDVYGNDRLFVALGDHKALRKLEEAGHPVVRLPYREPYNLGAEFFRWEFATAVAGHIFEINPFDQPNVQEAKDATNRVLAGPSEEGPDAETPPLDEVLATVRPGDYIALTAYLPQDATTTAALRGAADKLRERHHVAVTIGFGPRFLHSTGQLHKGGPASVVVVQVVEDDGTDIAIPGKDYTFGQLKTAQALGDLAALRAHGRRVARIDRRTLSEL